MQSNIGEVICQYRQMRKMTQEEFASRLGVTAQAVSKWENDISCPDIMTLPTLARKLGCTVDELLVGKNEEKDATLIPPSERKEFEKLMLRIICNSSDGETIRINLPLPLVRVLLDSGISVGGVGGDKISGLNIDWLAIVGLVEQGVVGKLVEIDSGDGDNVVIVVE